MKDTTDLTDFYEITFIRRYCANVFLHEINESVRKKMSLCPVKLNRDIKR